MTPFGVLLQQKLAQAAVVTIEVVDAKTLPTADEDANIPKYVGLQTEFASASKYNALEKNQ